MGLKQLLLLVLFSGLTDSASLDMTLQDIVQHGEKVRISVVNVNPSIDSQKFDRLDCGYLVSGSNVMRLLAQYDKHAKMFIPPSVGLPQAFSKRMSYNGNASFSINNIKLDDKKMIFYCKLDYEVNGTTRHVESKKQVISEVYKPASFMKSWTTPNGMVTVDSGKNTTIYCAVESSPASEVKFVLAKGNVRNDVSSKETVDLNGSVLVKRSMTLIKTEVKDSGSMVTCIGIPKYGNRLQRNYVLRVIEPKTSSQILLQPNVLTLLAMVLTTMWY